MASALLNVAVTSGKAGSRRSSQLTAEEMKEGKSKALNQLFGDKKKGKGKKGKKKKGGDATEALSDNETDGHTMEWTTDAMKQEITELMEGVHTLNVRLNALSSLSAPGGGDDGDEPPEAAAAAEAAPESLRDKIYRFMDVPQSSLGAMLYAGLIFTCIGISVINFMIETTKEFWEQNNMVLYVLEFIVVIIFTFDYVVKIVLTRKNRFWWALEFLNMIDLLSIVPFYVELILTAAQADGDAVSVLVVLRVLRLFRVFRILKVAKYSKLLHVVGNTLIAAIPGLLLLAFSVTLAMILFASMMFYAEQTVTFFGQEKCLELYKDTDYFDACHDVLADIWYYDADVNYDDGFVASFYQDVPDAFWWVLVTVTTVGYGDTYPASPLGKTVATLTMFSGILVIAFPLTIIGSAFADVYEESKAGEALKGEEVPGLMEKLAATSQQELVKKLQAEVFELRTHLDSAKASADKKEEQWFRLAMLVEALAVQNSVQARSPAIDANLMNVVRSSLRARKSQIVATMDDLTQMSKMRSAKPSFNADV